MNKVRYSEIHFCDEKNAAPEKIQVINTIKAQALIDDEYANCKIVADHNLLAFLVTQPWNEGKCVDNSNIIRVKNLFEVDRYLKMLRQGEIIEGLDYNRIGI